MSSEPTFTERATLVLIGWFIGWFCAGILALMTFGGCWTSASLGFRMRDVFERFCFLVLIRQQMQQMPREVAEWLAFRDVCAIHDQRGVLPS